MTFAALYELCARRDGVVTADLAASVDVRRSQLRRRASAEDWAQPYPGAWVLPGFDVTPAARATAAAASIGGEVALTGLTALAYLGLLPAFPSVIDVAVPANRRRPRLDRVNVRWTSAWPPPLVEEDEHAVAVTDVARSLALLGGRLQLHGLRGIAFDAVSRRLLTPTDIQRELDLRGRFAGRADLRRLVHDLTGDGSESGFEFSARDRLRRRGLPPRADQPVLPTGRSSRRIDIAFDGEVGIDCQSLRHHASPADLESDAVRDNEIAAMDRWLLLRLTFRMFYLRWDPFEAQLRHCLASRGVRF
ncbi:hypothetical protein [Egicoccus sp. AB-alg2]|uniref:hypothetical protein n=1 Tax=Egicoccus sp. AB-alg2 TaxID=3242693 RepID=UPI00359DA6A2